MKRYLSRKKDVKLIFTETKNGRKCGLSILSSRPRYSTWTYEEVQKVLETHPELKNIKDFKLFLKWKQGTKFKRGTIPMTFMDGKIQNLMLYSDYSGAEYDLGEPEWDGINDGIIDFGIWIPFKHKHGGADDKLNDCLLEVIRKYKNIKKDNEYLKNKLNLDRDEMIPVKKINKLEDLCEINICCITGCAEIVHSSSTKYEKTVYVYLTCDNHYEDIRNREPKKPEKEIILYNQYDINNYEVYTNNKTTIVRKEDIYNIKKYEQSVYTRYVYSRNYTEELRQIMIYINALSKIGVDITKFNLPLEEISFTFFTNTDKMIPIRNPEQEITLNEASKGGIIYAQPGIYNQKIYLIDFISFYPSIMKSPYFMLPIGDGSYVDGYDEILKISKKAKKTGNILYPYGIYYLNDGRVLTHYDIEVGDKPYRALYWRKDQLVSGKSLFEKFVDTYFIMKQAMKGLKEEYNKIKTFFNMCWGYLARKNIKKFETQINKNTSIINDNNIIYSTHRETNKNILTNEAFIIGEHYFKGSYPQIKPFLLGRGRQLMRRMIEEIGKENIARCVIDGMYVLKLPDGFREKYEGSSCGDLEIKEYKYLNVKNLMRYEKE